MVCKGFTFFIRVLKINLSMTKKFPVHNIQKRKYNLMTFYTYKFKEI